MKTLSLFLVTLFVFLFPSIISAQDTTAGRNESGKLQLGMRSVVSAFSDDGAAGMGIGGQFRLKLGRRMNTDWFADYIRTDIGGIAHRTDYHIGWSVLYYPFNADVRKGKLTPYILAGHCFDWTDVRKNEAMYTVLSSPQRRFSSAVQSGLGLHYNVANNFDISLTTQYMLHIGEDIRSSVYTNELTGLKDVLIEKDEIGLEGHLLINLSLNVYIADLWNKK